MDEIQNGQQKNEIKKEVAGYIEDTVLDYVSKGLSPVDGQAFKPLSKGYKKIKSKISGSSKANMELYGDMLDDFEVRVVGSELSIGFHKDSASETSLLKAERHNHWTERAKTIGNGKKFPKRQFIPKGKQEFSEEIMADIKEIITGRVEQIIEEASAKSASEWMEEAKQYKDEANKISEKISELKEKVAEIDNKKPTKVSANQIKVLEKRIEAARQTRKEAEEEIKLRKENIKKLKLKLKSLKGK